MSAGVTPATRGEQRRPRLSPAWTEVGWAALAVVLTIVGLVVVLRLWRADLGVPFRYDGDAIFNLTTAKGLIDHGWWFSNPNLGAPFGQDLHDFAMGGDHLHLLALKLLGVVTGDAVVSTNLYFLLSFPLSALTAFAVLRWLRVGAGPAVVCSVLFALTPFAFLRGELHLLLMPWPVPLAAYLVLAGWRGTAFERRPATSGLPAWATRRTVLTLAACVVVGSTGSFYYPVFAIVLVAGAAALGFLAARSRRNLVLGGVIVATVAGVSALNLLPTTIYSLEHGRNESVAKREAWESEFHGLKLAQMVLPVEDHRVRPLADLKKEYADTTTPRAPSESFSSTLGLVATVGLAWLLLVALAALAARPVEIDSRTRQLSGSALMALLVGTVGGLGAVFAFAVTPQLRGLNRISIFIAFFSLAALALLLDRAGRRLASGPLFAALLAATLVVGLYEQTSDAFIPDYDRLEADYRADEDLVRAIERRLPGQAEVLQLPAVPFPESQDLNRLKDYELSRPYLHSDRLRWSYGAMKERRPADWQWAMPEEPRALAAAAAASGFGGIYVDRQGYSDHARRLEAGLARTLGAPPIVRPGRQVAFFELRGYRNRLAPRGGREDLSALRAATLRPLRLEQADGRLVRQPAGKAAVTDVSGTARLRIVNPTSRPRRARIALGVRGRRPGAAIRVRLPDGSERVVRTSPRQMSAAWTVGIPAGAHVLELHAPARPAVTVALSVTDDAFTPYGTPRCTPGRTLLRRC